jgi:branched-chain amino acid transport system substrate-binding protein
MKIFRAGRPLGALLLVASLWAGPACAARSKAADASMPALVTDAAALGGTDRTAAIALLEAYLTDSPAADVAPWATIYAGEQRRLGGDSQVARRWFEAAAERYPTHPAKDAAVLGMALVDAGAALSGNTVATLQLIDAENVPDTMNADRYRILARLAHDEGTPARKVRDHARRAVEYAAADPVVEARVKLMLADLLDTDDSDGGPSSAPNQSAEEQTLSDARAALAADRYADAARLAATFQASWPTSSHSREVAYLARRAANSDPTSAGRVCGLLPLSGEYAAPGKRLQEVLTLANTRTGSQMELRFADTAGDPTKAVAALEKLVIDDGCVAIVGPLLKEEAGPVAEAAQALRVPIVTLSQSGDPQLAGDYVFNGFLTLEQQVNALLDQAMGTLGKTKFAVMLPANSYGESTRDLFAAGVEKRGGVVVRVVSYDENSTDFRKKAQELAAKDYKARAGELARIRREYEAKGQDPSKATLPPIVEFDAIFIPDNYRRVRLLTSALAYEEFAVGSFRPFRGASPMLLLGLNGWNNSALAEGGGQYVEGAIFVDAFLPTHSSANADGFATAYREAYGREPMVIDAVAYDATRLLASAVGAEKLDRDKIRSELLTVQLKDPITGGTGFGADRQIERKLLVLTVANGRVATWQSPEDALPAEGLPSDP